MATGYRTYGQFVLEAHDSGYRVDTDFADTLDNIHKTRFPLAAFSSKKGNSVQKDTDKFVLFEEDLIPRTVTLTDPITTTDAAATIGVSSTDGIVVGTLLHVPAAWAASATALAGELLRVTAVTTSIAVARVTTDVGIADTTTAVIIGNAVAETSTASVASFDMEPTGVLGYMNILKRSVTLTKTEKNNAVRGAADRQAEKLNRAKMDFMLDIEHNTWFSRAVTDSTNKFRYSMGIISQIAGSSSAVKTDAGGDALSLPDIGDSVAKSAKWSDSNNYVVFHGGQAMAGLWELEMGKLESRTGENKFGMYATTVNAPGGMTLDFVFCRVFDIIGAPYSKMLVGLDMSKITPVHLKGGRPMLEKNVEADPGGEVEEHQWRCQGGIAVTWPQRHWITYDAVNYS